MSDKLADSEKNDNLDELIDNNDYQSSKTDEKGYNQHDDEVDLNGDCTDVMNSDDEILQTEENDKRSIFVKNVDYQSTKEQITEHFKTCGKINRVTIIYDKYTNHPKGCCYVEFGDLESAENSKSLNNSIFNGRQLEILPKRTNKPFFNKSRGAPRGRGGDRGGFRGGFFPNHRGGFFRGGRGSMMFPFYPRGRGFNPYK